MNSEEMQGKERECEVMQSMDSIVHTLQYNVMDHSCFCVVQQEMRRGRESDKRLLFSSAC